MELRILLLASAPLAIYLISLFLTLDRQVEAIPDNRHSVLDRRMTDNLALAGFSLTVISLLVSLFKAELALVSAALTYFSLSLGFFLISYIFLHLRLLNVFDYASGAFTNSGLWSTLLGLWALFSGLRPIKATADVMLAVLVVFAVYIITDAVLTIKYMRKRT